MAVARISGGVMDLDPQLAASGISPETAHKAGVTRITTSEAHQLGFVGNGCEGASLSGLAFPYRHPVNGQVLITRIRPDVAFQGRKYLAPIGSRNHLYLPLASPEQLDDPRFPLLLCEGEKKTLSLLD